MLLLLKLVKCYQWGYGDDNLKKFSLFNKIHIDTKNL